MLSVCRKLKTQRAKTNVTPCFLDLRSVALASEEEMQDQLNANLINVLHSIDYSRYGSLSARNGMLLADMLQEVCAASDARVIIFIDHFDSVPHFFSRCISRQIRSLYEKLDVDSNLKKLGVIVAGVLSIFSLKRETDSAFAYFSTETMPPNPISERVSAILDQIPRGRKLSADMLEWLAEYCGPDPAFLTGITDHIQSITKSKRRTKPAVVKARIRQSVLSGHSILRMIAIHIWSEPYLFDVVRELLESKSPVAIREAVVDVPIFQLLGVVRVDNNSYVFRNQVVHDHAKAVYNVIRQCSPPLTSQQVIRIQMNGSNVPGIADVLMLDSCRRALQQSNNIADVKRIMSAMWRSLRPAEEPEIEISVDVEAAGLLYHEAGAGDASEMALRASRRLHRTAFGWDNSRVCVCVPIKVTHAEAFVSSTLNRGQLQGDFSESALRVWIQLVEGARVQVITHALLTGVTADRSSITESASIEPESEVPTGAAPLSNRAVDILETVLFELAFERPDSNEFIHDLIERARLPREVRIAALRCATGSADVAIRRLLRWALDTDRVSDDPNTPMVERLVTAILGEVGIEQRRLLLSALLQLPGRRGPIELMAAEFRVPIPAYNVPIAPDTPACSDSRSEWELQSFLRKESGFLDIGVLKKALTRSLAVCMISFPRAGRFGSGVLLQNDLLVTNYHVIAEDAGVGLSASEAVVQLGFTSDGPGIKDALHAKAVVASSPTNALDYAVLRLAHSHQGGVELSRLKDYAPGSPLHILQHPSGESMKLALSQNGVVSTDKKSGKIKYVTATSGGSSGAPCFDGDWNLVAIHRAEKATAFGSVREGVLLEAIVADAKL
jgi:hypothetical protein